MYEYWATVAEVIDGDTVRADIDLGFHVWYSEAVRLYGINAPELSTTAQGQLAKAHLATLLPIRAKVLIKTTLLKSGHQKAEKYGRVLGEFIYLGINVNQQMLADGFAVAYFGEGKI